MALAVTAAGMSSIPASAYVPSITRYANFTVGHNEPNNHIFYCSGVLSYTPGSSEKYYYCSTTAPTNTLIKQVGLNGGATFIGGGYAGGPFKSGRYYVSYTYYYINSLSFRAVFNAEADGRYVCPYNGGSSILV